MPKVLTVKVIFLYKFHALYQYIVDSKAQSDVYFLNGTGADEAGCSYVQIPTSR